MATKPSELPRWADAAPDNVVEPLETRKDSGYLPGEPLPAQAFNWLFNLVYQWLAWFNTPSPIHYVGDPGEPAFTSECSPAAIGTRPNFWLDRENVVRISGSVSTTRTSGETTVFTLPAGYRPTNQHQFQIFSTDRTKSFFVRIGSDGLVLVGNFSAAGDFQFDGVSFRVGEATIS